MGARVRRRNRRNGAADTHRPRYLAPSVKITNLGDARSGSFVVTFDYTKVDRDKISAFLPSGELSNFCKPLGGPFVECEFGNALVKNDSLEIPVIVTPKAGASGAAGSFSVTVASDLDTTRANNTATAQVAVAAERGVDIVVWAEDVVAGRDEETGEVKRVAPGGTATLHFGFANGGSLAAKGITIVFALPQDVTLVQVPGVCTVNVRIVTCVLSDVVLQPDEVVEGRLPVKVGGTVTQQVDLVGAFDGKSHGTAEPIGEDARRRAPRSVPEWLTVAADDFDPNEVDNKDNHDEFVVFVGAPTGGGGGGLPLTGPKAIAIGGVGAAVLVVGVLLVVGARRRRVVLVTPAE